MKASWHKWYINSGIFLKIGFIVSLGLTGLTLNWTTYQPQQLSLVLEDLDDSEEIPVVRTRHPENRLPPPPLIKPEKVIDEIEQMTFVEAPISKSFNKIAEKLDEAPPVIPKPIGQPTPPAPPVVAEEEGKDAFIYISEQMPRFGNCDEAQMSKAEKDACSNTAILRYIGTHIKYPPLAREAGIEGTVVIEFKIDKTGKTSDALILRDIGGGCGAEALRVVQSMKDWTPGKQRGRPVNVIMRIPVKFQLQ